MKLKLDDAGHVVVSEGKPVYVKEDGSEVAFDAVSTVATITRLNGEAKSHRERFEAAEKSLKAFEGLDASKAREALDKLGNIEAKKLIDAGEVEKVKSEVAKVYEEKLSAESRRAAELEAALYGEKIGGAFARSNFVKEKLAIPPDFVEARFGQNFKLEEGKVVAYDGNGNKIFSPSRPGEIADFDEALSFLVNAYPQKDYILKGTGSNGSGAKQSNGGGNGAKTISRAEYDSLGVLEQREKIKSGVTIVDA